jgi:galactose mutarotase-like enzyme
VNDQYRVQKETYHLGQHGFARDMVFEVANQNKTQVTFSLKWNNETLKVYPFKFEFFINYKIEDNRLSIEYTIKNVDDKIIYFSVGAHPGFNCPLTPDESFDDYYLEFENNENASVTLINSKGTLKRNKEQYLNNQKIIELNDETFKDGALVFDHLESKSISLKSKKSDYCVHVSFKEFPFLGIWTLSTGAPFVCIEPWIGHADYSDFKGDFIEKEDQIHLDVLKSFTKEFVISIK